MTRRDLILLVLLILAAIYMDVTEPKHRTETRRDLNAIEYTPKEER